MRLQLGARVNGKTERTSPTLRGAVQEGIVTILLYAGSVGLIAGVVLMLAGLGRSAASDRG
jgi:hypothetical protein